MKRYIITTAGGLGNQMMNYSLWFYLNTYKHPNNCILYPKYSGLNDHNGYELDRIFPLTEKPYNKSRAIDIYLNVFSSLKRIINKLNKICHTDFFSALLSLMPFIVIEFPNYDYTFLSQIKEQLSAIFQFNSSNPTNCKIIENMQQQQSVSIHIRRGDYQNNPYWRNVLGDICNIEYYSKAISIAKSHFSNPVFYIFSDDIAWAKKNLPIENMVFISHNCGENSYLDMQLMTFCKINIIANSTFSLMGAWLNRNNDAVIIAPTKWRNYRNDDTGKRYISKNWLTINNSKPKISISFTFSPSESDLKLILAQGFDDFEILTDCPKISDSRIVNQSPGSVYQYQLDSKEIMYFKDSHWLNHWLEKQYKNEV